LRVLLPALSGLALASARKGREATVEWATSEVWTARALSALHHETASALVESAAALSILERTADARRFRNAGQELARRVGLHELDFQADAVTVADEPSTPVVLRAPATRVLRRIEALEPEQLPRHVVMEAAPA
jgi:hypothetical protein